MTRSATPTRHRSIRIVLVEQYALVRATLREIMSSESDFEVVAEVADIQAAIELMRHDPADVVVVDTELPVASIVPALQELKRECPMCPVVLLGHRSDDEELFRAIQAGAAAHVLDVVRPTELVKTIRAVADGEYVIDASVAARPAVARRVLEAFRAAAPLGQMGPGEATRRTFEQLSARETQILTLVSEGMANKDIAAALSISQHTVNNHIKGVLRKLAVNNRTQAVLVALRESWIPLPDKPTRRPN